MYTRFELVAIREPSHAAHNTEDVVVGGIDGYATGLPVPVGAGAREIGGVS